MDLNISALQTAPEKRCFPFPTMVYSACSMETGVAFRTKCKIFSRHLQNSILKTEKGRFKGL